jgi:hypothetical protein
MRQFVRTDQGAGWVNRAEAITYRGRMFTALAPVSLRLDGRFRTLPAGTIFGRNRALERRTRYKPREEQRTHIIVEEGLHDAERLCYHVRATERVDHAIMVDRHEDIARVAKDLVECGQLSFKDHAMITTFIESIREDFDEHKTNPHKVTVRTRLDTANNQRTKAGRFKPAPAALTAYASTTHIRKRLDEIAGIHAAFSTDALEVGAKLRETELCMESVWEDFQPNSGMIDILEQALANKTRSRPLVVLACHRVDLHRLNLEMITAMPYRPLADAALHAIHDLKWNLEQGRVKPSREACARVLELVRRMRMIWYVQRSLIWLLSFLPDDGTVPTDLVQRFRQRLGEAEVRVTNIKDAELDPEIRRLVAEYLEATRTNLDHGDYELAKEELKRLTRDLRTQPLHPPARKAA